MPIRIPIYSYYYLDWCVEERNELLDVLDQNADEQFEVIIWFSPSSTNMAYEGKILNRQQVLDIVIEGMAQGEEYHRFYERVWAEEMGWEIESDQ